MGNESTFVNGMIAKRKDNAPEFVLCNLSLKVEELITFMQQHQDNGWVNIDVKRSKQGKVFAALNTWKPTNQGGQVNNNFGQPQPSQGFQERFQQEQPYPSNNGNGDEIPF